MDVKHFKVNLLTQMTLLIIFVVFISTLLVSILFSSLLEDIVENYVGKQAMTVAKLAAQNPKIIQGFKEDHPSDVIQPESERIRHTTGADYVTIANRKGLRYSHPNPEYIGQPTATSNDAVFNEHKSIIYQGNGISGPAIKAKTPILDDKGEIIGVSSVGFLVENVQNQLSNYKMKIFQLSLIPILAGIVWAIFIARRLKKLILGLEPEEISFLYQEREAALDAIRNATITINIGKQVTSMNKRARELFHDHQLMVGKRIVDGHLAKLIKNVFSTKEGKFNRKVLLGQQLYIVDLSPILNHNDVRGVVLTIRTVSEIEQLTEEFSEIKAFSENMRAQNHEFLNKLNTIYGLLSLKQYDRALNIISSEVRERQDIISFLMSSVQDPLIAACLLGKKNRSKELQVMLEIDHESNLNSTLKPEDAHHLVSIIGNVIDNAMEAAWQRNKNKGKVKVSFTDLGNEIIFDIEDNGPGIPQGMEDIIFTNGYTTKTGENHGIGLAIVKNSIDLLSSQIYIDRSNLGGARFTIALPKDIKA
ncbi:ATP-binding protein [Bacillus sp. mrc49]|uniref:ATP-binding protein n=1 Tax=Bacillus sp. mrc49 TaxID=2054913 RepID=UPI001E42FAC3|nr:sensor histidine kinase [Bacillus sp. mrc49]